MRHGSGFQTHRLQQQKPWTVCLCCVLDVAGAGPHQVEVALVLEDVYELDHVVVLQLLQQLDLTQRGHVDTLEGRRRVGG